MSVSKVVALSLSIAASFAWLEHELEAGVTPLGGEYSILGQQIGDQFLPQLALGESGGYLVWQDNNTDGDGLGVGAVRLDGNLNAVMGAFQVNQVSAGDQQRPAVTILDGGGAAVVWESNGDIFIRFVNGGGVFVGPEQKVNSYIRSQQQDPAITTLDNGNVVVVWGSMEQDGDLQGVFGQIFDSEGDKIGAEFIVNQSSAFNQRTPCIAALEQGDFVVSWISEQIDWTERGREALEATGSERFQVSAYGRVFDEHGNGVTDELLLGDSAIIDANPAVAAVDGGFVLVTSGHDNVARILDRSELNHSWDIYGQIYDSMGNPQGDRFKVNEHTFGDQVVPFVAGVGDSAFITWTSLGQDGDQEGVFGQFIDREGQLSSEFQINTATYSKQMFPTIAVGGEGRALVVWAGFSGGLDSFDLMAQQYSSESGLPTVEAPFAFGAGYWSVGVSWPFVDGVEAYEVYLDGADTPVVVSGNRHTFKGLTAGTEHTIQLAYIMGDGSRSAKSQPITASTWSRDENSDGLPDDWQRSYWGASIDGWPAAESDADGDGVSNFDELLAGTDPSDAASLLLTEVVSSGQGLRLRWNTRPGGFYQVQFSTDIGSWLDAGAPRLAVDISDSISISNDRGIAVYRVWRVK